MDYGKKERKKQKEPELYMSAVNMPVINYHVYYMKFLEKMLYFLAAFFVGAIVGYLFYGGIGKDEYGNATTLTYICDAVICISMGLLTGKLFLPIRTKQIIKKKKDAAWTIPGYVGGVVNVIKCWKKCYWGICSRL